MRNTILGIILTTLSASGLALATWRFDLLQRYVPFLLHWGSRPWPRFPATKIGLSAGCLTGIAIGCLCLDSQFKLLPRGAWAGILTVVFLLVVAAAIHDYLLHKNLMSRWRKEAAARLPELQPIIASRGIDTPMMLWQELCLKFEDLCQQQPPSLDVIRRIWGYAKWCMESGNDDAATAAALGFCEHLLDRDTTRRLLPQIMTRQDYESLKALLLYHNSEEEYAEGLKLFEKEKPQ